MKRLLLTIPLLFTLACVGSALGVPTPTSAPDPAPSTAVLETSEVTPLSHKGIVYRVAPDVLEVRALPGETSLNVGFLETGEEVNVFVIVRTPGEYCSAWARIGSARWVCADRLELVE